MAKKRLRKPRNVENDPFLSAKWDELTYGRNFTQADAPNIALLCTWHQVIEQCRDDLASASGISVAYMNDRGDIQAMPQLSTMKQASAEIRQLNKLLGIVDAHAPEEQEAKVATQFQIIQGRRQKRVAGA